MLKHLSINNYVLISDLSVDFKSGLSAITGETGAGKSILLGALGFVLGERTDTSVLLDKDKKCVVEALFEFENDSLSPFFEANELDYDRTCVLRREFNAQKKSRSFINDMPVTLAQMKELGSKLIDIHSQHDSLLLVDTGFQLSLLDEMAHNAELLSDYKSEYSEYVESRQHLNQLRQLSKQNLSELDFYAFQLDELRKANLVEGEYDEISERLQRMENSEQIMTLLQSAGTIIQDDERSVLVSLSEINSLLSKLKQYVSESAEWQDRVESARIELKDIAFEIENLQDNMQFDDSELAEMRERMDLLNRLMHKHHVDDYSQLLAIRDDLQNKVDSFSNVDAEIVKAEQKIKQIEKELRQLANELHANRLKAIDSFEKEVTATVRLLAMPHGIFKVACESVNEFTESGTDAVRFLFSANKGVEVDDISHVSGGELSRLMLVIKRAVANCNYIPTLIFDEIDTGVSGNVASKVAGIMHEMSDQLQVIAITHLPQIASAADNQMLVYKEDTASQSQTCIKALSADERVTEIAKMMSNDKVTEQAIEAAKVLLSNK